MHGYTHTHTHTHTHTQHTYTHSNVCIFLGEWSSPQVQNRPQPMGVITFTRISNNKAVIFAGNYEVQRSDDLYVFDLDTKVNEIENS